MAENHEPETPQDEKFKNDAPGYAWHEVWMKVLANPSEKSFDDILSASGVSTMRALRWVFFSRLTAAALALLVFVLLRNGAWILQYLPQLLVSSLLGSLIVTLLFAIVSLFLQFFARLGGGEGTYEEFHYAFAASVAPMTLINTLVALTGASAIFGAVLSLYQLALMALAVKTVNRFSWGRTIITLLAVFGVIGLVIIPLFVLAISLLVSLLV